MAWIARIYDEPAGSWWAAAGATLAAVGVLNASGIELPTAHHSGDPLGPLAAWLLYRGVAAYFDERPLRWPAPLCAWATALGLAATSLGAHGFALSSFQVAEIATCGLAAYCAARQSTTTLERLLSVALGGLLLMTLADSWLRSHGGPSVASQVGWITLGLPVAFIVCAALLDKRLRRARQALDKIHRDRLVALGTLTAGLAHQVNNPVGSILAAAQLAQAHEGRSGELESARRAMHDIVREAKRTGVIVQDMLRSASLRTSQRVTCPIDEILEAAIAAALPRANSRGACIEAARTGDGPCVEADRSELELAILQLLINAIESKPSGAEITVERSLISDLVRIRIRDDGRGMSAQEREHGIVPFFTSHLEDGSTGLGLSVAHGIVSAHDGRLTIDSEPGKGTTVCVELPVSPSVPWRPRARGDALNGRAD